MKTRFYLCDDYDLTPNQGHETEKQAIEAARKRAAENDETIFVVEVLGVARPTALPATYDPLPKRPLPKKRNRT